MNVCETSKWVRRMRTSVKKGRKYFELLKRKDANNGRMPYRRKLFSFEQCVATITLLGSLGQCETAKNVPRRIYRALHFSFDESNNYKRRLFIFGLMNKHSMVLQ